MSAKNTIEEIITTVTINDKVSYLIKYKEQRLPQLKEEDKLTKSEKEACRKYDETLLNKKRKKSDYSFSESIKNIYDNDKEDYENSSIQSSIFSNNYKKSKKKDKKNEQNKENKSENKKNGIKTKIYEREGCLAQDKPLKILNVGYKNRIDHNLFSFVRWKQHGNIKLLDSIVENKKIRKEYPELLIDYYESRMVFLDE